MSPGIRFNSKLLYFAVTGGDRKPRYLRCTDERGRFRVGYCSSPAEFVALVEAAKAKGYTNVFLTPNPVSQRAASFPAGKWLPVMGKAEAEAVWNGTRRPDGLGLPSPRRDDIAELRGVMLDFDSNHPKGVAATDQELADTLSEAQAFLTKHSYPHVLVNSGNGAHLFLFHKPLPVALVGKQQAWAESLPLSLRHCKLDLDAIHATSAFRLPGFKNTRKDEQPKHGRRHRTAECLSHGTDGDASVRLAYEISQTDAPFKRAAAGVEPSDVGGEVSNKRFRQLLGDRDGCRFFQFCWHRPKAVGQHLWYCLANLCRHLTPNGSEAYHLISRRDKERYRQAETQAKFDLARHANKGPTSCRSLAQMGFICPDLETCPHRSPAKFGSERIVYWKCYQQGSPQVTVDRRPKPRGEARRLVQKRVRQACAAPPGTITVINAVVGIGKTMSLKEALQSKRAVYLGPNHRQCREFAKVCDGMSAVHLHGPDKKRCRELYQEVTRHQASGAPYLKLVCEKKHCPRRASCPAYRQRTDRNEKRRLREADILIAPVQSLLTFRFFENYDNGSRPVLVFDEDPVKVLLPERDLSMARARNLLKLLRDADPFVTFTLDAQAISALRRLLRRLVEGEPGTLSAGGLRRELGLAEAKRFSRWLAAYSTDGIPKGIFRLVLRKPYLWSCRRAVSDLLAFLSTTHDRAPLHVMEFGGKRSFSFHVRLRIPADKTVVVLDGTSKKWVIGRAFDRPPTDFRRIQMVEPRGRVIQFMETFFSRAKMNEEAGRQKALDTIRQIVEVEKPKSLAVISYMDVKVNGGKVPFRDYFEPRIRKFFKGKLRFGHFGAVEGSNELQADVLVVIGGLRPNTESIRESYEALFSRPAPAADDMPFLQHLTADGKWDTYEASFHNKKLRKVYEYHLQRSLVQAVGRARHVYADKNASRPPTVYLICHHPLKIVGLARYVSEDYFRDFQVERGLHAFSNRLLDGERVDIVGELKSRFTPSKDDLYVLVARVIERIQVTHRVKLHRKNKKNGHRKGGYEAGRVPDAL